MTPTHRSQAKVGGLIRRAALRYPDAELRRLDLLAERSLDRGVIAQLGTCTLVGRAENVVFHGFTGSGRTYLGSALTRVTRQHQYRALYIRMPDLEEAWHVAADKPGGQEKFLRKYAAYPLLTIDEWLLDQPSDSLRGMFLELSERRFITVSAVTSTPTPSWTRSCTARSG